MNKATKFQILREKVLTRKYFKIEDIILDFD